MPTIFLVEDSPDLADYIRQSLESAGYTVLHSADGLDAAARILESNPDLILLDWMLPGIDGIEVLRRIRDQVSAPVMMLTARSEEIDRVVGLELGADDYLTKPFSMRELLARVHAMLRRSERLAQILTADRQPSDQPILWQDISLNPASRTADIAGRDMQLTQIEFDLLALFIRNPGRVFTREYLLEAVWNQPFFDGDRSVDNSILRLRRKMEPLGDSIEAVRGLGYRLRDK
jgi:two-component system phosphate regulon response regulator PhoB